MVVGAGPTGLALACGLRAAAVEVRVLDGAAGPAVTSRALGLQPRGVEVLDRLGALGDLPDSGLAIRNVVITVNGRELARLPVGQSMQRLGGRTALLMSQADIEAALRDRLAALGGSVEWGRGVADVTAAADGVELRLGNGDEVRAGWVVGADGAHSVVRKAMRIGFPGVPVDRALPARRRACGHRPAAGQHVWVAAGNTNARRLPAAGGRPVAVMTPHRRDAPTIRDKTRSSPIWLSDWLRGRRQHTSVEWTSTFRIHRRLADTYRRGRMMLAGDAAHIHSPLGGQGMNTGIGDAENLAWKLALVISGRADAGLLDTYEAERRPIAKDVLTSTSGVTELVGWPRPDLPARARPNCRAVDEPRLGATPDRGKGVAASGFVPARAAGRATLASATWLACRRPGFGPDLHWGRRNKACVCTTRWVPGGR